MKQPSHTDPALHSSRPDFTVASILLDFADTTWRIAVPVIILTLIGIFCDKQFGTKPWLTFLGVIIGFGIALALIRNQLQRAALSDKRKEV